MPRVQQVELQVLQIALVRMRAVGREDVVVLAPDKQGRRLVLAMPGSGSGQAPTSIHPGGDFLTETEFRAFEKENMLRALKASGWRISGSMGAAERLGVKPSTLAYRMSVFGIEKPR